MFEFDQLLLACALTCGATLFGLNCPAVNYTAQENSGQRTSAVSTGSISLSPCEVPGAGEGVKEKVRCGSLEVFEDRSGKNGRKIALNGVNTFLGDYRLRQQRAACAIWRRGNVTKNYAEPTRSDVPALILTGQWDPVTPPIYGDTAAKYLSHSLHVIVPHGGHGFSGLNGLDCIDNLIVSFISRGTTTGLDTSCVNSIVRKGFMLKLPDSK